MKAARAASTSPSFEAGLGAERDLFADLMSGPQAKALQYFFYAERKSSKIPDIPVETPLLSVKNAGYV